MLLFRSALIALIALSLANCAAKAPAPGGITPEQRAQLKALPMPVAIPRYVPKDFKLARVSISSAGNTAYSLLYEAPGGRRFVFSGGKVASLAPRSQPNSAAALVHAAPADIGKPDDVRTIRGCTLATTQPFGPRLVGLIFTVYGCATSVRPAEVVRTFESATFVAP